MFPSIGKSFHKEPNRAGVLRGLERFGETGIPGAGFRGVVRALLLLALLSTAPQYDPGLSAASGEVLPNFSDGFSAKAPDMGAHFRDKAQIQYGVRAK
jgi:hypothetical protein